MNNKKIDAFISKLSEEQKFEYDNVFKFKKQEMDWIEDLIFLCENKEDKYRCCEQLFWIKLAEVLREDYIREPTEILLKAARVVPEAKAKVAYLERLNSSKRKLRGFFSRDDLLFIDNRRQTVCHMHQTGYHHKFSAGNLMKTSYKSALVDEVSVIEADAILKDMDRKFYSEENSSYKKAIDIYSIRISSILKDLIEEMYNEYK